MLPLFVIEVAVGAAMVQFGEILIKSALGM